MGSVADKLLLATKKVLGHYEFLLTLCKEELRILSASNLNELQAILNKKEVLIQEIQENLDCYASLWTQVEGEEGKNIGMNQLEIAMQNVRETVYQIQKCENEIAVLASNRFERVQEALGSLARSGKVLEAYKPTLTNMPRFVDKKE